jgi:hypothetical protein
MNALREKIPPAVSEMRPLLDLQRAASAAERLPSYRTRQDRLARLTSLLTTNEARFAAAVDSDFGDRSYMWGQSPNGLSSEVRPRIERICRHAAARPPPA